MNSSILLKNISKHTIIYAIGGIITNGGNLLLLPIYTRFLTPSEYGIVGSVAILSTLIISILGLGLSGAITRFYFDSKDKSNWKSFLGSISVFVLLFGFIVTILLLLIGGPILDLVFVSVRFNPYLRIGILISYFGIFPLIPLALIQAKSKALKYRMLTTISFLLLTCFMLLFVVGMKQGALGALKAQLLSNSAMAFYYGYYLIKESSLRINKNHIISALKFSVPIMIYTILGIAAEMSSRYLVERFTNLSDFGLYSFALLYSSGLTLIASSTNMAWVPIFYKYALDPKSKYIYGQYGLYYICGMCGVGLGMSLFSKEIISIIASESFHEAGMIIPILVLSCLLNSCIWTLAVNPIFFKKKTIHLLWITGTSTGICILFGVLLIPNFGILGASVSLLLSNIILVSLAFIISLKLYPVRYDIIKIGLVVCSSIVISTIGYHINLEKAFVEIIVKITLIIAFIASLFTYRILNLQIFLHELLRARNRLWRAKI